MARLLPLLIFAAVAIFLAIATQRGSERQRDPRAFRPRARRRDSAGGRAAEGDVFVVRAKDLAGLRDACSGAPLDPSGTLVRCVRCDAYYHVESTRVLARDNGGRCATCGSTSFGAVTVSED